MNRTGQLPRWVPAAAAGLLLAAAWLWWRVGDAVLLAQLNGLLC